MADSLEERLDVRCRTEAAEQPFATCRRARQRAALANMGDYDWDIPTDTNRWSDQLFRIYGYEPQSFSPTTSASSP